MAVAERRIEVDMGFLGESGLDQERGSDVGADGLDTGARGPETPEDGAEGRTDEDL